MRTHLTVLLISLFIFALYFNVGLLTPQPDKAEAIPDANDLRKEALQRGLAPIPASWREALPLVDNPDNPLIPEQIEEAVRIMARHQLGLTLTREQIESIVAFLKTLEGDVVEYRRE
ncbi:hypothetical protein [Hydrogenimonas sp.]